MHRPKPLLYRQIARGSRHWRPSGSRQRGGPASETRDVHRLGAPAIRADEERWISDGEAVVLHRAEYATGRVVGLDPLHQALTVIAPEHGRTELSRGPIW